MTFSFVGRIDAPLVSLVRKMFKRDMLRSAQVKI